MTKETKAPEIFEAVVPEVKDTFLPEVARAKYISQLEELGIENAAQLSDGDLLSKLSDMLARTHEQVVKGGAKTLTQKLVQYGDGSLIKDKEFLERLLKLNVFKIYLRLFRDQDKELSDDQIWERIRASGINPLPTKEVVKERAVYKPSPEQQARKARMRQMVLEGQLGVTDLHY